jgi:hypothetical protein
VLVLEEFPVLIHKEEPKTEPQSTTQKTWASLAAKAPNPSAAKLIEESNRTLQKQVEETNKKRAAKKHQEWVERQEKRKKREEKQNRVQQEEIQRKIEIAKAEYGHRWYAYVEDTELDCKLAEELRYNEMQQYYDYEYEQIQEEIRMSKLDTLYNRNKKTMSREEFREWLMEWEEEDDFSEYSIQDATRVCIINTPAVTSYYNKTGLILHPDDFVSRERDAPLKPGLLRKNNHLT